jgi:hypothetical protein
MKKGCHITAPATLPFFSAFRFFAIKSGLSSGMLSRAVTRGSPPSGFECWFRNICSASISKPPPVEPRYRASRCAPRTLIAIRWRQRVSHLRHTFLEPVELDDVTVPITRAALARGRTVRRCQSAAAALRRQARRRDVVSALGWLRTCDRLGASGFDPNRSGHS